jgi:integrase
MTRVSEGTYDRHLSNGKVVFDIVYEGPRTASGGRNQKWERGFTSLTKAKKRRAAMTTDVQRGAYVEPAKITLGEFMMERFESRHGVGAIRDTTYDGYKRHLANHVVPELGDIRLQALTTQHLNRLWAEKARAGRLDGNGGLSSRTIRTLNHLISQTLVDAQSQGLTVKNVAIGVNLPREVRPNLLTWSAAEARRFLDDVHEERDFPLYHLDLTTGMRRGELLGLKWSRVDLDAAEIVVAETVVPVDHRPIWSVPKTDAGFRTLPLDKATVAVLREHRRRQLEERLVYGSSYLDLDLVFPDPGGSAFNPENLSKRFYRRIEKAGLVRIRFHDLRHTYATLARRSGMDIKVLSDRLGHASIVTTINLYQHVPADMAEEAAQSVADFILG